MHARLGTLTARHVTKSHGADVVLDDVSLVVSPEARIGVVGRNGVGKTTLLRLLNRLDDPDAGSVLFDGRDVRDYDVLELRRRVQYVGQVPVTFPGTVSENLGGDSASLLQRVGLPAGLASREADRLSVGEAQRMCLARALGLGPEALALDEPTSALDTASKAGIEALIAGLAESGLTVVMVTHDPRHTELADHVVTVAPPPRGAEW